MNKLTTQMTKKFGGKLVIDETEVWMIWPSLEYASLPIHVLQYVIN